MLKETTDYALSNNNTITLTSGVSANDILESITFAPFNVANVLQPNNNLNDVASASTALTNLGGMSSSGGTFSGNVSLGSNDLSTTGKILFANMYATTGDLPSATTYHGMFAHVHATGKAYFAHGGSWIPLANESALSSYLTTHLLHLALILHNLMHLALILHNLMQAYCINQLMLVYAKNWSNISQEKLQPMVVSMKIIIMVL